MSNKKSNHLTTLKIVWLRFILVLLAIIIGLGVYQLYSYYSPDTGTKSVSVLSKLGSRGDEVRKIQSKLKSLGLYTGSVDGIYGTNTQNAVKAFQKRCGLTIDGIAGKKTLLYLGITTSSSSGSVSSSADLDLLARIINAEARGESYTGQVAVGAVVLNRVRHPSFPDSISGVIYQAGAFSSVYRANWYVSISDTARKAARDAMNGWDPTGGAIYFYNPAKTSDRWILSRPVIKVIGNHRFCL